MKQEDMQVGQKVWYASIIDNAEGRDQIVVREYDVVMMGKRFFELRGNRARIRGMYVNNRELIRGLRSSPAEAVNYLHEVLYAAKLHEEEAHRRAVIRFEEQQAIVTNWFAKAGL